MKPKQVLIIAAVVLVVLAAFGIGWVLGRQGATDKIPAKLNTGLVFTGGSAAPILLAEEKGYFAEGGVRIDIVRGFGSNDAITKVAAGTYEAAMAYLPELVRVKAGQPDLDAIAVVISNDGLSDTVSALKTSGIRTPRDLEGKKINAQAGGTPIRLFPLFAQAAGIDATKVEFVTVDPSLSATAVQQGKTDATTASGSALVTRFAQIGYKEEDLVQFKFKDYIGVYGNALILRKSWAVKYPDAARGLVRAYIRGLIYSRQHPDEAIDALIRREPLLQKNTELVDLKISNRDYNFTDNVLKRGVSYQTADDVAKFIHTVAAPFEMKREPAANEIYDPSFLPPLADRTVK